MRIVPQYDLTTAVGMDKFAQEIILAFGFVHIAAADSKWREIPMQVGRASHKRAVLAPVVVSAMFRTKLLGDATMQQINRLYALTCVASSFSWYVTPRITHCTPCAW